MPESNSAPSQANLTIYDLDGVLIHGDTMASLVTNRLKQKPLRLLAAIPLVFGTLLASSRGEAKPRFNRALVSLALRGLDEAEYIDLARITGLRLGLLPGIPNRDAILAARTASGSGTVIVVTASEFHLARAYLDTVGLHAIQLIASELAFDMKRGPHLAIHNVGPTKLARLIAEHYDPSQAVLYTDSSSDLPLATVAKHTVLVNPDRRSRRTVLSRVADVSLVYWS